MAFERIGLGAVLSYDGKQLDKGMSKNRDSMGRFLKGGGQATTMLGRLKMTGLGTFLSLSRSMKTLQTGFSKLKSGILSATLAFAPLTIAAFKGAKTFIDFQQQMQNVKSVSSLMPEQFAAMTLKAKELGASTQFTATQAGEAFENLSRAGFSFEEQLESVSGVLDLAAADSIGLAEASEIASNVLQGMQLPATEMTRVADILAQTSANAATNVTQLGEAFKQGAPLAAEMGVEVEDAALALGLIANAGIKGSAGGTAFKNMLVKLAKPSSKALAFMEKYNLQTFENVDGTLDLNKTMRSFIKGTSGISSATERAGVVAELFGLRSVAAVGALKGAIKSGKIDTLADAIADAEGAAKRMAAIRLDSFSGQMTLLGSAVGLIQTEFFGPLVSTTGELLKSDILPFLQGLGQGLLALGTGSEEQMKKFEALPKAVQDAARGMMDAIEILKSGFESIVAQIREWSEAIGASFGPTTIRDIVKFATTFAIVGAALTPVLVAVIGIGFAISALISIVTGVASILAGAFLPVLLIAGLIGLAFITLREDSESFGDVALRVWQAISDVATDLWDSVLKPLWQGISQAAEEVLPMLQETWLTSFGIIKEAIIDLFEVMGLSLGEGETDWVGVGETIVRVFAAIIETVLKVVTIVVALTVAIINAFKQVGMIIFDFLIMPFQRVGNLIGTLAAGFITLFSGDILGGLEIIGEGIFNFFVSPLRLALRTIIRLADAIPGLGDSISQNLRDFANEGAVFSVDEAAPTTVGTRGAPKVVRDSTGIIAPTGNLGVREAGGTAEQVMQQATARDRARRKQELAGQRKFAKISAKAAKEAAKKAPCIDNNVNLNMDSEAIARGQSRHNAEIKQRTGFTVTPWQRKTAAEFGAAPIRGGVS